jgi:flagellar P-ring protein precursor FlgI
MTRIGLISLLVMVGAVCALAQTAAEPGIPAPDARVVNDIPVVHPMQAQVVARVKDVARVQQARDNQLYGYGLVVGLNGTGDTTQTQFTTQALGNMLRRLGIVVDAERLKVKNVAAVMITAIIPPFVKSGDRLDVTVSSLGDATSLQGGVLLQTPLTGADGRVYIVAQGPVSLGGYSAESRGASKSSGHPTVGRIPGGALVEREIPTELTVNNRLSFALNQPDFATAARMATAINDQFDGLAHARDAATVDVRVPEEYRGHEVDLIARLGALTLVPDTPARVVINERTGTVVVGGQVTVAPVALAQGNLTVSVNAALIVSQPPPLTKEGETVAVRTADVDVEEPTVSLVQVRGSTIDELVRTMNGMKVSPRDIIAILQALKQSGALQAELVIM